MKRHVPILAAMIVAVVVAVSGCGGGGGSSSGSQFIAPVRTAGRVALPPGFSQPLTGLTVHTGIDAQPVAANGAFAVKTLGGGPAPATLQNSAGKVVLMGYVDGAASGSPEAGGNGQISAQQTAVALLFAGTACYTLPPGEWQSARAAIAQSPQAQQVATVISDRAAADPTAVSDGDQQLAAAVKQASLQLLGTSRASASGGSPFTVAHVTVQRTSQGRDAVTQLLVEPSGEQSGVEVINDPKGNGILFVNHIRRRAAAFIYETARQGATDPSLQQITPVPMTFSTPSVLGAFETGAALPAPHGHSDFLELQPSGALNGIFGSITDVLGGTAEQPAGAFTPTTTPSSGDIALAQDGASIKTEYTVIVIGPAIAKANNLGGFPLAQDPRFQTFVPDWQGAISGLTLEEGTLDVLLPFLGSIILPDNANIRGLSGATAQELALIIAGFPDANQAFASGDFQSGVSQLIQVMVDNSIARDKIITTIYSQLTPETTLQGQLATAESELEPVLGDVAIIEFAMQSVDIAAVVKDSTINNPAEEWTAAVVNKTVRLTPPTANVGASSPTVELTATPGLEGDPNSPFLYDWSVAGSIGGGLEDSTHTSGQDTNFDSVDSQVTYAMNINASVGSTDTVTVQVFLNSGTFSHPARGQLIGQAQCVITAIFTPCSGNLPQGEVSGCGDFTLSAPKVAPGGTLTVTVTLKGGGSVACGSLDANNNLSGSPDANVQLNGNIPVVSASVDGTPQTLQQGSSTVTVPGIPDGQQTATHTVTYVLSGNAPEQCPSLQGSAIVGPWVQLIGFSSDGWETDHAFDLEP